MNKLNTLTSPQLFIELELTNRCNTNCFFCPRHVIPKDQQISTKQIKTLLQRINEYDAITDVVFCGRGEPLLHKDIVEIIKLYNSQNISVSITSNGLMLTPTLSEQLCKLTIKEISISIHTTNKTKALELGFADLETVIDNLEYLSKLNPPFKVEIQPVLTVSNEKEVLALKTWAENKGFSFLTQKLHNRAGSLDQGLFESSKVIVPQDLNYDIDLSHYKRKRLQCSFPFVSCFVSAGGEYFLCCQDFEGKYPLGNIATMSIRESLVAKAKFIKNNRELCRSCIIN